jgi:carbonic anhydrase
MSLIDEALSANATIANDYDPSRGNPPAPKIAIVTCADPRLTDIEQMLGLAHADVDMIRSFGTVIDDDAVRSLILSTRGGPAPHRDGTGADCAGQVLQLHRR